VLAAQNITLAGGRTTALLGASGSGKSTLLRLIAGLLPLPPRGEIAASDGRPLTGRVAWMAQQDLLLPWRSVLGNVVLGDRLRGAAPDPDRARALLDLVGLQPLAARRPGTLSGGQRQRAALARTLMEDRPIVLMDEPFSAIDAPTRHRLQALAAELLAGRTVVLVTHDPTEALRMAHDVLVLRGAPAVAEALPVPPGAPPRPPEIAAASTGALLAELAEAS
jgi:putative hydroxymethylpyrimidine transport system ATP-binding protein